MTPGSYLLDRVVCHPDRSEPRERSAVAPALRTASGYLLGHRARDRANVSMSSRPSERSERAEGSLRLRTVWILASSRTSFSLPTPGSSTAGASTRHRSKPNPVAPFIDPEGYRDLVAEAERTYLTFIASVRTTAEGADGRTRRIQKRRPGSTGGFRSSSNSARHKPCAWDTWRLGAGAPARCLGSANVRIALPGGHDGEPGEDCRKEATRRGGRGSCMEKMGTVPQ